MSDQSFFARLSQQVRSSVEKRRKAQRRKNQRNQLRMEMLESRQLLATFANATPITIVDDAAANPYPHKSMWQD